MVHEWCVCIALVWFVVEIATAGQSGEEVVCVGTCARWVKTATPNSNAADVQTALYQCSLHADGRILAVLGTMQYVDAC